MNASTLHRLVFVLLGLACCVPLPTAHAETSADEITLEDALRILRQESPRWAAERAQLGLADAEVVQAGLISNPSLSYNLLQLGLGANTGAASTHQVTLEQPLLLFGQRGKRLDAARAGQRAAQADLAARFAERACELHHAFVALLGAQEKLRLLTESQVEMRRAETIVRARAAAGDRSQYDALRIALEARALDDELASAESERQEAAGQVAQLVGRPGWQPRARGDLTPIDPTQTLASLLDRSRSQHPAIAAARQKTVQAQASVDSAARERAPEIALQVGMMATQAEDSLSIFAGFSTPLPLWNRQQGSIAKARAMQRIAAHEERAVSSEVEASLSRTLSVARSRHAAAARMATEVFAHLPQLRFMAEESYRQGKSGIVDLLDAFRSLKSLRMQYVEQLISAERAEVDLLYAAGVTGGAAVDRDTAASPR